MEAEARAILVEAVSSPVEQTLTDILLGMREILAGQALEVPTRAGEVQDAFE